MLLFYMIIQSSPKCLEMSLTCGILHILCHTGWFLPIGAIKHMQLILLGTKHLVLPVMHYVSIAEAGN